MCHHVNVKVRLNGNAVKSLTQILFAVFIFSFQNCFVRCFFSLHHLFITSLHITFFSTLLTSHHFTSINFIYFLIVVSIIIVAKVLKAHQEFSVRNLELNYCPVSNVLHSHRYSLTVLAVFDSTIDYTFYGFTNQDARTILVIL